MIVDQLNFCYYPSLSVSASYGSLGDSRLKASACDDAHETIGTWPHTDLQVLLTRAREDFQLLFSGRNEMISVNVGSNCVPASWDCKPELASGEVDRSGVGCG